MGNFVDVAISGAFDPEAAEEDVRLYVNRIIRERVAALRIDIPGYVRIGGEEMPEDCALADLGVAPGEGTG